ncbi:MAG TPA: hypothetical protein VMA83_09995 [Solirubrobacteraceae bacterium]|nr:hypothetical protein [Solirubrobacteraceae bacterium]
MNMQVRQAKTKRPLCASVAALAAFAVLLVAAAPAGAAQGPSIKVLALTVRPQATGGVVGVKIEVKGGRTCSLTGPAAIVGLEWEGRCPSRAHVHRIWIPENTSENAKTYRVRLVVHGSHGTSARTLKISVPGEAKLVTGEWLLTIKFTSGEVAFAVTLEPNGLIIGKMTPITGHWEYKRRVLKFDIAGGPETVTMEGSGGREGPFRGSGVLTGAGPTPEPVTFTLTHV